MTMPVEQRTAILQTEIGKWLRKGYVVMAQTPTTAQLTRGKKINCCLALVTLPFAILRYITKRDKSVYLEVDADGVIHKR